jgi:ADP-ribosylglycohydrolase
MIMTDLPTDHAERVARAKLSLNGLSLGDAFGERFFGPNQVVRDAIAARELPQGPWRYTDDTVMALAICEVLERYGCIEQDALARAFAAKYTAAPSRGYGPGAHRLLSAIAQGARWREASRAAFGGVGSFGNGGAMRVAPVGAYFADDLTRAAAEAQRSAEITHAHPEGQAGAVAVATAAACCARGLEGESIFEAVLEHTPEGDTRRGIIAARALPPATKVDDAAQVLGSGAEVSSQDTVPFVIWCIAHAAASFEDALWTTVAGLGDRDTTCAMVGGAVALRPKIVLPEGWFDLREPLSTLKGLGLD